MLEIIQSDQFQRWLMKLRDDRALVRINLRIDRLALGNAGNVKPVGGGISEMKIDYGPGYRIYFTHRGPLLILLLCGGDKSTQSRDIAEAKRIAYTWKV